MTATATDVLWTSGWDSTFRVADLIVKSQRTVQPWYLLDSNRRFTKTELASLERIRQAHVELDPSAADRLLPVAIHRIETIPPNAAITGKWRELRSRMHLGSQYDWLARFADARKLELELSIHCDDKAHAFLEGVVEPRGKGAYRLVDDALTLFERFTFAVFDLSKIETQDRARRDGFGHVMEMTRFCYAPLLDGKPCGYCNPCKYTREEGLGRRIPKPGPARRLHYRALNLYWLVRVRLRRGRRRGER